MNSEHERDTTQHQSSGSESMQAEVGALVIGISEVITAALGVGVSMTRIAAKVTSPGASDVDIKSDGPIPDMVHYGATTVSNLLSLITTATGITTQPQTAHPTAAEAPVRAETTSARLPQVRRGSTLRIPLSIENPTSEPMVAMSFTCLEMLSAVANADYPLDTSSVRFQPAMLNIAPKDFEKLTVFIDTTPQTTTGLYQARIGLNTGLFETEIQFEVIPAENET